MHEYPKNIFRDFEVKCTNTQRIYSDFEVECTKIPKRWYLRMTFRDYAQNYTSYYSYTQKYAE